MSDSCWKFYEGDATNFVSVDELDASWAVFSPALLALEGTKPERYAWWFHGAVARAPSAGRPRSIGRREYGGSDR